MVKTKPFIQCWLSNSTRWALNKHLKKPKGIMIHSTGFSQPYLNYFVRPSKSDPDREKIINILGEYRNFTDYNHTRHDNGYHFWIGKDRNDKVQTIYTLPLDLKAYSDNYIHIIICEDDLKSKEYLIDCLSELVILCDWLLDYFPNLQPKNIIDHSSNGFNPDIKYWLEIFNFDFDIIPAVVWALRTLDKETGIPTLFTLFNRPAHLRS